jgi:hypothetical protein
MEGKMKKIKVLVMLSLFLGTAVCNLFAQYLDVGDDPEKIQITSTKNVTYNGNPVGGYAWSYDGEWFLGANNDGNYVMDKNGVFLQKLPRKINYYQAKILYDNKRIFYDFYENKKRIYAIYNIQTAKETVLAIDSQKEHFLNISPFNDILLMQVVVVAKKSTYKFVSLDPNTGIRQDLGFIRGVRIYYSNSNNFYFIDKKNLLLLVSDNGATLKNYDFTVNKLSNITNFAISEPSYSLLHDGRHVVVATFDEKVCLFDTKGALLGKFNALFDRGEPDIYGINPDLIPGHSKNDLALAPNGKIIMIRMKRRGGDGENQSDEVYLFNFQGKNVRFIIPYPFFASIWNPQGDRLLNGDLIVFLKKTY